MRLEIPNPISPSGVRRVSWHEFVASFRTYPTILSLSIGLAVVQTTSWAEPSNESPGLTSKFQNCVLREIKSAIDRASENELNAYGSPIAIENYIIAICNPKLRRETYEDNSYTANPLYMFLNNALKLHEKAISKRYLELSAQRLKAEKQNQSYAVSVFIRCAETHAQTLATASNEAAEVIAEAALASCPAERLAVKAAYHSPGEQSMRENLDKVVRPKIILDVIATRAPPATSPEPKPTPIKTETPI